MPVVPSAARLLKSLPPHRRPQSIDIAAISGWTVVGLTTAIWLVQVIDPLQSCFFLIPPKKCFTYPWQ
jgi:hypothetical protein